MVSISSFMYLNTPQKGMKYLVDRSDQHPMLAKLPLGVSTERRSILLPNVPTIAEAGVAGFDFPIWYGIWIPAGTATGVAGKLAEDIARVLAGPDLRDWIVEHGGEPMSMAQPEFARFVQSESASAARLIKAAAVERQ
jgi:tripartite-type tricarboxylate transporter receptor subunit TctC